MQQRSTVTVREYLQHLAPAMLAVARKAVPESVEALQVENAVMSERWGSTSLEELFPQFDEQTLARELSIADLTEILSCDVAPLPMQAGSRVFILSLRKDPELRLVLAVEIFRLAEEARGQAPAPAVGALPS